MCAQNDTDNEIWIEASSTQFRFLSREVPPGLFFANGSGLDAVPFLIVGTERRFSILLNDDSGMAFQAWELTEERLPWYGSYVGPVELLLDVKSQQNRTGFPTPGDVSPSENGLTISVKAGRIPEITDTLLIEEGSADTGIDDRLVYPRWALFQTGQDGHKNILYQRRP